jgi:hypothetical protein
MSTSTSTSPAAPLDTKFSKEHTPNDASAEQTHPPGETEHDRMVSGRPYLAMTDSSLLLGRLRVRRPMQAYNNYPWPDSTKTDDYFGPDERRALLGDVFGMTIEEVKEKLEIEPPFYVDYVCLFSQISRAMLRLLGHKYNVRRSLLCQYGPNHPRRRTC